MAFLIATVGGSALFRIFVVLWRTYDWALIGIGVMFFFLLIVPLAVLFADGSWFYRGILLMRDLRQGIIKVFSGRLIETDRSQGEEETTDETQYHLVAWETPIPDDGTQTLEVLPTSRRIWQENGARIVPWIRVIWKEVAKPPESAVWLSAQAEGGRRRMSERERAELFREARRHWQSPAFVAFALSAFLVGLIIEALTSRITLTSLPKWGGEIHVIWFALAADAFAVRRWREARRMSQDARKGEVERLPGTDAADSVSERLPISERPWTQSEHPAAWRQRAG